MGTNAGAPTTGNISLDIKYIFINFLQQFFANHATFTWNADLKLTKIVIADKNAVELEIVEKRPAIICARGGMAWTNVNAGQKHVEDNFFSDLTLGGRVDTGDSVRNATYTDLLQASMTLHILSKSGIQAEQIASEVFQTLTVYKPELRKRGIHKVSGLSIGEEQNLKTSAAIEYASVPISINFLTQRTLRRGEIANNCQITVGSDAYHEGINYLIINNGSQVSFETAPPAGATITVVYVDANTLQTITTTVTGDSTTKIFTLPSNGSILGYYSMLKAITVLDNTTASETQTNTSIDPLISGEWVIDRSGVN